MSDKTVFYFNKWFRAVVGILFIGVAIYYKDLWPAIFGALFIGQAVLNRGCHGECFTPYPTKRTAQE